MTPRHLILGLQHTVAMFGATVLVPLLTGLNLLGPNRAVLYREGKLLGHILTGQRTANCNWGDDGSTLYMTADFYICRIKTRTRGAGW